MNATIGRLTFSTVLGRRRALLLFILPGVLLLLAIGIRWAAGADPDVTAPVLQNLALGTIVPLIGLIAGTGVIGPEIDDGSIVYILAKPLPRRVIVVTKMVFAVGCIVVFAALPILLAGVVMSGFDDGLPVGFAIGAAVAGIAYAAVFLLLAVVTRHAVVVGLIYALVWESLIGSLVPGARTLSIQQWALSVTDRIVDADAVEASVRLAIAVPLVVGVTLGATWLAVDRLRSLTLSEAE